MRIWIIAPGSRAKPLRIVILLAVYAMLGPVPSIGSDTVPDMVKGRQEAMKAMAYAGKTIAGMFEGKLPYDAPAFKRSAETIRAHSGAALMAEFPAASLGPPSAAKHEIDQSRDEFDALARKVASFASVISASADKAPDGITPQMRMGAGMSTIGSSLLGKRKVAAGEEDISKLPAEHAFHLMLQECSACHAKFREKIQ
jgi:cytochrome c556